MRKTKKKSSKIKELVINHINNNLKSYIILSILFLIGVVVGVICINKTDERSKRRNRKIYNWIYKFT